MGVRRARPRPDRDREPSDDIVAAVPESDPVEVARAIALRQLTMGPRSRAQLEEALARRLVPDDVARTVLDRFEEVGLVDDSQYAAMLVRTRHAERGLARRALARELRLKGVDDEHAREALAQVSTEDEEQAARAIVRKRLRAMGSVPDEVAMRRLVGMLARKGHSPGVAMSVVRSELSARGREVDEDRRLFDD